MIELTPNTEKIAKEIFKKCPSVNKYELTKQLNRLIKDELDHILDDPFIEAITTNEGYFRVQHPNGMEYKVYKNLIDSLPDDWSIIMPGPGTLSEETYDSKKNLRKKFWGLHSLRTIYDVALVS